VVGHALPVVYRIDAADIIEDVNDAWAQFAIENDAPLLATEVIGKSIWDYICGPEVRHIYASVFKRVRKQHCQLSFPFRCDSPSLYRAMRLLVSPMTEGRIEFCSVLETISSQPCTLDILSRSSAIASTSFLKMCSWCKAIEVGTEWKPIEKALEELGLLTEESFPTIKQSFCESCLKEYMQDYIAEDVKLAADIQDVLPFIKRLFGE
jgi:hypothetical protein